jgi:hypothetical protein
VRTILATKKTPTSHPPRKHSKESLSSTRKTGPNLNNKGGHKTEEDSPKRKVAKLRERPTEVATTF